MHAPRQRYSLDLDKNLEGYLRRSHCSCMRNGVHDGFLRRSRRKTTKRIRSISGTIESRDSVGMRLPASLLPLPEYRVAEHSIVSIDITREDANRARGDDCAQRRRATRTMIGTRMRGRTGIVTLGKIKTQIRPSVIVATHARISVSIHRNAAYR